MTAIWQSTAAHFTEFELALLFLGPAWTMGRMIVPRVCTPLGRFLTLNSSSETIRSLLPEKKTLLGPSGAEIPFKMISFSHIPQRLLAMKPNVHNEH